MRYPLARVRSFAALAALVIVFPAAAGPVAAGDSRSADAVVRVESFSPQGYVRQVRQVVVRFTGSMVALGDPRLADPFTVSCPARGRGRWADTRDWVFDFDADLDAGIRCRFTLKSGLKSASGAPLTGPRSFRFQTGGPAIVGSLPHDGWAEIDEE
jgi:alpha-2-macroglobulin